MKNKAHNLSTYAFSKGEGLLLDANVWLYLFPAPSDRSPGFARNYSAALKRMLLDGTLLALDALVLSEYMNRYCRIEWSALHKAKHPDFKKFRQSSDFGSVGLSAAVFSRKILQLCSRHDHPFASCNVTPVIANLNLGHRI